MKFAIVAAAALSISGCASLTGKYHAIDGGLLSPDTKGDGDNEFAALMTAIGKDRATLLDRGNAFDFAEGAFSLAVLAAAAYGAFNTTYDGSNLKDAAFAAGSITGLRSFIAPGRRRDAYLRAGSSLNCLHENAQIFDRKTLAGDQGQRTLVKNEVASDALREFAAALTAFEATNSVGTQSKDAFSDFGPRAAFLRFSAASAGAELTQALDSEAEIFNQRFSIVSSEYIEIISKLFNDKKFSEISYETKFAEFKKAVETQVSNKKAGEKAAAFKLFVPEGASANTEQASQFADAKAAIEACSGV